MHSFRFGRRTALAGALLALATLPAASSTHCVVSTPRCTTDVWLSEYTGTPTVPCLAGHPVVQVSTSSVCNFQPAGSTTVLRCGVFAEAVAWSGGFWSHKLGPSSSWEDVLDGECDDLVYQTNYGW